MQLGRLHHVAVICGDYEVSKRFYTEVLGLRVVAENYRAARNSYKLDLALPDGSQIELFSFPGAPQRPTRPEAQRLATPGFRSARRAGRGRSTGRARRCSGAIAHR